MFDLQKANAWKRISAYIFDGILLVILGVGIAFLLSAALKYDSYSTKLQEAYAKYEAGELNIRASVIIELRKLYNCTYDDFFEGLDVDMDD